MQRRSVLLSLFHYLLQRTLFMHRFNERFGPTYARKWGLTRKQINCKSIKVNWELAIGVSDARDPEYLPGWKWFVDPLCLRSCTLILTWHSCTPLVYGEKLPGYYEVTLFSIVQWLHIITLSWNTANRYQVERIVPRKAFLFNRRNLLAVSMHIFSQTCHVAC